MYRYTSATLEAEKLRAERAVANLKASKGIADKHAMLGAESTMRLRDANAVAGLHSLPGVRLVAWAWTWTWLSSN